MNLNNQPVSHYRVKCPHCRKSFSCRDAEYGFRETLLESQLTYALCPTCCNRFANSSASQQKDMANTCFRNFKTDTHDTDGNLRAWAVTTELALLVNHHNLSDALEYGHDLPKAVHDAFMEGRIEAMSIPPFVWCKEDRR